MDFNGYKRTKKFDIKRWFKGTNSIVYLVILVVMVLGLLFVLRTVISMHNSNKNSDNVSQEETTGETDSSEKDTQTQTIAKNKSYYIRISIVKHTLVVYQLDDKVLSERIDCTRLSQVFSKISAFALIMKHGVPFADNFLP